MSDRFKENIGFVEEWVLTMRMVCPANEKEDFDWIINALSAGIQEWENQRSTEQRSNVRELPEKL